MAETSNMTVRWRPVDRYFTLVYLTDANEQRDAWAELQRAYKSFTGRGLPYDPVGAREIFDRIHQKGRSYSAFCLAYMHEFGLGVEADPAASDQYYGKAFTIFREEADAGLLASLNNLGFMYSQGKGVTRDPGRAVACFREAAERGFVTAQLNMGLCRLNGWGVDKDDSAAFEWFRAAAEAGCAAACGCLAYMYREGLSVPADPVAAIENLRLGAEGGDTLSWLELGEAYYYGRGVAPDRDEAVRWLDLAANDGNAAAQGLLASILLEGKPTAAETQAAVTLLEQASDQGSAVAEFHLARLYIYGNEHFPARPERGKSMAESMSFRGAPEGNRILAELYAKGIVFTRDRVQAAYWMQKAAAAGDAFAQAELADYFVRGHGVPRNLVEAYAWFLLAAPIGLTGAAKRLADLRHELNAQEVNKAARLAEKRRVHVAPDRDFQLGR